MGVKRFRLVTHRECNAGRGWWLASLKIRHNTTANNIVSFVCNGYTAPLAVAA